MSGTTNLNDLPMNPSTGNPATNVVMTTNEIPDPSVTQNNLSQPVVSGIDNQKMMNEVVSGIQQASASGSTNLPPRDIPMETSMLTQDQEIKPDYLPNQNTKDYIFNSQMEENVLLSKQQQQKKYDSLESMYEELQIPIIIGLLYFVLQLPVVKKYFHKFFPSLYYDDGNPSFSGYVIHSVLFAALFYIMLKVIKHFSQL